MIEGFTKNAVVVFQEFEDYDKTPNYKNKMRKAVENLRDYLTSNHISMCYFTTDDVARLGDVATPDKWLASLNKADTFFVSRNCRGMEDMKESAEQFEDVYVDYTKRFPIERGMSVDRRFEITLKREAMAKRLIMRKFKLVVTFGKTSFEPKAGSGVMYLAVDAVSFNVKAYMSDMNMDVVEMLGIRNANMPMYEWEVIA